MSDFEDLKKELEQHRDEIKLKLHLASMEMKDEWSGLEGKWDDFSRRAGLAESSNAVSGALGGLGEELKSAYQRFKKAL